MGYISELKQSKIKNIELGPVEKDFLLEFLSEKKSAWDLFKLHKSKPRAYKNTLKIVKSLFKKRLIEKLPLAESNYQKRAVYYKLSTNGIVYILTHRRFRDIGSLILPHRDNPIFKTLVFPHFLPKTIRTMHAEWFHFELSYYISDCLNTTLEILDHITVYPKIHGLKILDSDNDESLDELKKFLHRRALNMAMNMLDAGKTNSSSSDLDSLALCYLFNDKRFHALVDKTRKVLRNNIKTFSTIA